MHFFINDCEKIMLLNKNDSLVYLEHERNAAVISM